MSSDDASDRAPVTHIQALYFELIKTIQYNQLDGAQVVAQLLEWRGLWHSVIADRLPTPRLAPNPDEPYQYNVYPPLSLLRTTRYGDWPADTLYIWTDEERLPRLQRLIRDNWPGSLIEPVDQDDVHAMFHGFYQPADRVFLVWWD